MEELREQALVYQGNTIMSSAEYVAILFDEENIDTSTVLVNTDIASVGLALLSLYAEFNEMWEDTEEYEKELTRDLLVDMLKPLKEGFNG